MDGPVVPIADYQAFLFDMDGVLTSTMKVHAAAWESMFNDFLRERSPRGGERCDPFDPDSDYRSYVDGKLRYDGVRAFLASRNIRIDEGEADDPPTAETICGLGNRKDLLVKGVIASQGVDLIEGSIAVLHEVRALGLKTAVVSASKNCRLVLEAAGISGQFDCIVDGLVAEERGLAGKPAPDTFLEAARLLMVEPGHAVVVEDAISGVEAASAGGFGLVIGIDHHGDEAALISSGADIVVDDLARILVNGTTEDTRSNL